MLKCSNSNVACGHGGTAKQVLAWMRVLTLGDEGAQATGARPKSRRGRGMLVRDGGGASNQVGPSFFRGCLTWDVVVQELTLVVSCLL